MTTQSTNAPPPTPPGPGLPNVSNNLVFYVHYAQYHISFGCIQKNTPVEILGMYHIYFIWSMSVRCEGNKMVAIQQTTFSKALFFRANCRILNRIFDWGLFARVEMTITQNEKNKKQKQNKTKLYNMAPIFELIVQNGRMDTRSEIALGYHLTSQMRSHL